MADEWAHREFLEGKPLCRSCTIGNGISALRNYGFTNQFFQLYQVADAIAYLHSNKPKVIHGDIKGVSRVVLNLIQG